MRDSLGYFIKRDDVIAAYRKLISPDAERPVLMVDGLSGTGKSLLIDWLRRNESKNVRTARILLSPALQEGEFFRSLVSQLNPAEVKAYDTRLEESDTRRKSLVSLAQTAEARLGGSVDNATQTITLNMQDAGNLMELQRRSERIEALTAAISDIDGAPWVIFFDESEHLSLPDLHRTILQTILPALRARFQNVRFYFTGQSVPSDAFERFEVHRLSLGMFDRAHTEELLRNAEVEERLYDRIFKLTDGHPLLLGMWLDAEENGEDEEDIEGELDEEAMTRWIYDRVVSRFPDANVRRVAANLSLLEWFDLGLLRSIYDEAISEEAFDQMIRRSFIKSRGKGRWRCHDIVRKYLPAHRRQIDPEGCREVYQRSADAFQSRLDLEQERAGTPHFAGRLDIALALFNSLHGYSADKAETFITREIARQIAVTDTDYVFAVMRYLDSIEAPRFRKLAAEIRAFLDAWSAQSPSAHVIATLERLGRAAEEGEELEIAATLYISAAADAAALQRYPDAIAFARRAVAIYEDDNARLILGRLLIDSAEYAGAEEFLKEWEARGKSAALSITRASLAAAQGDFAGALRELEDALNAFPENAVDISLRLADLALLQDDTSTALRQLDAVLGKDPENYVALTKKSEILVAAGNLQAAGEIVTKLKSRIAAVFLDEARATWALAAPGVRERIIFELENDPTSVPVVAALRVTTSLAIEGNVGKTDKLVETITATWPETSDLGTISRAIARLATRQFNEIREMLEPLAARKVGYHDVYQLLETAYGATGKKDDCLRANRLGREILPGLADLFDGRYASYLLLDNKVDEALKFLDDADRADGKIGPNRALIRANIHVSKGNPEQALQTIEEVIYTDDVTSVPLPLMITLRLSDAAVLRMLRRREEAVQSLDQTIALFPNVTIAFTGVAREYAVLGEEARLRALIPFARNAGIAVYAEVFGLSVNAILSRNPSVPQLLEELNRDRDAMEIVGAIDRILTMQGRMDEVGEIVGTVERIAPGLVAQFEEFRQRIIENSGQANVEQMRQAAQADPQNIPLKIALAEFLAKNKSLDEAMLVIDEAIAVRPGMRAILTGWKARKLMDVNRKDEAAALLDPFIQMDEPPPELIDPITSLLAARKDSETAIAFYRKLARKPASREGAINYLARTFMELDRPQEALDEIEAFGDKANIPLSLSKAQALSELGRTDEALLLLNDLAARDHVSPVVRARIHAAKGHIQRESGAYADAIESYETALQNDEHFVAAHLGNSLAHEAAGNARDAYEHLKQAIALDPSIAGDFADRLQKLRAASAEQ